MTYILNPTPERAHAPVQGPPGVIPWAIHLEAYAAYSKRHGPQLELINGRCRGGFCPGELDEFVPGWRARAAASISTKEGDTHAD